MPYGRSWGREVTGAGAAWGRETAPLLRARQITTARDPRLEEIRRRWWEMEIGNPKPGTWPLPDHMDWDPGPNLEFRWDAGYTWGRGPVDQVAPT